MNQDRESINQDVEIRQSRIDGNGVFAVRAFQEGDIVLRWDLSHVIPKSELESIPEQERRYTHPYDEERILLVQAPERYVNHSCGNNTAVRDFCDVAVRAIAPGEEITSDYSSDGSGSSFACTCGDEHCRGTTR